MDSETTSSNLLNRVRQNDELAWTRLARLYGPLVYRWARLNGLQEDDAADIGQEVFQVVAKRIGEFRRDQPGQSFRGWLWTISKNKIGDFIRQQQNHAALTGLDSKVIQHVPGCPVPDESIVDGADSELIHAALRLIQTDFHQRTWQAFWRTAIGDQTVERVAEELQMTNKAVRQAKYRVLKRLREEFDGLLDSP
jgi:RNA polymerase sigma-70 factor (ECF subfamily)